MKPNYRMLSVLLLALIAIGTSGCLEKKTNKKTSSSSNTVTNPNTTWPWPNPTPTVTPTDPPQNPPPPGVHADLGSDGYIAVDCTLTKSGGLSQSCVNVPTVTAHGCKNPSGSNPCQPTSWSSSWWPGNAELSTDSELNIRVIPRSGVGGGGPSSGIYSTAGSQCKNDPLPYTLLSMTVEVKSVAGGAPYSSFTFEKIPVNKPSLPYRFRIPPGLTGPVVVEVKSLEWDCPQAGNCGTDPTRPMEAVWASQCVRFDVQFSTDSTKSWNRCGTTPGQYDTLCY